MTKKEFIKILLENALGILKERNSNILQERIKSLEDPEYPILEKYHTRFNFCKQSFDKLSDSEKIELLNDVEAICNGKLIEKKYPDSGNMSLLDQSLVNILAAEYVSPNDVIDGWSPNYPDISNIKIFLMMYYSPYEQKGTETDLSSVAYKALPQTRRENPDIDIVIDSFFSSLDELLDRKKYDPDKSPFDFYLMITWRDNIKDFHKKVSSTRTDSITSTDSDDDEKSQDQDLRDYGAEKEIEVHLKTDKQKFDYILSNLSETDQKIMKGFYNFISMDSENDESASKKMIDIIYDNSGDLEKFEEDKIEPASRKNLYYFIGRELGVEVDDLMYKNLKVKISQLRQKLLSLFRDPKFKESLGMQDWSEKDLDLLKATGSSGKVWKKVKKSDLEYPEEKSIAYDKYGNPVKGMSSQGKIVREFMFESINSINNNFNYRFGKISSALDKIINLNNFKNEGFEVAVKDLDEDIYRYINNTVNSLEEANYILNELESVSDEIKFEFPDVSEKLHESVKPLVEELINLISKIKNIRKTIKPFLNESNFNNEDLNEMDLEEERITNPESKDYVKRRENFIGSHIYGEDLGGLGKMYVAYSYGEQFPAYVWYNDQWYHNTNDYVLDDGTVNEPTNQHKADMRPVQDTHGLSTLALNTMINKFKKKNGLGDNVHTDVEPGEKN